MPDPSPVDPEVAAELLRSHLSDFFRNSPRVLDGGGWAYEITKNPLVAIVRIPALALDGGKPDIYCLRLDGTFYDTWPVSATFVEALEGTWQRARIGSAAYSFLSGSPGAPGGNGVGFPFALHDDYPYPSGTPDQLICFSYNFGYYVSNHAPNDSERWRPGQDRLDATLSRIHSALNGPGYRGSSKQVDAV